MRNTLRFLAAAIIAAPLTVAAQVLQVKEQTLPNPDNVPTLVHPVPAPRQLKWQETEFYAFSTTE